MSNKTYKIIIATGGTGGHLFPAQGLAEQMQKNKPGIELLFAGTKLSENAYFDKTKFSFYDVTSMTPFGGNIFKAFKSVGLLLRGIFESYTLLSEKKPDLVIGFGSFHSFPVICAAFIKKIPLVLFESNSVPGKVIKLFSRKAIVTGIYFEEAKQHLKGKTVEVEIPIRNSQSRRSMPQKDARHLLGLDLHLPTLLVFGGSQGAKQINEYLVELLPILKREVPFQLIHLTGSEEIASGVRVLCAALKIPCYVKKFETKMDLAWNAADIALCRSGAMTLSEILYYEVPAILLPYPFSSDQHQLKNALFLEQKVGGAIHLPQALITIAGLSEKILRLIPTNSAERLEMKKAIKTFKSQQRKEDLCSLITRILYETVKR